MLSPPDIAVIGIFALLVFGPDQLPKVARRAGQIMREVQNTSQTFIREMEKAADDMDLKEAFSHESDVSMSGPKPTSEKFAEPSPSIAERERLQAAAEMQNDVPKNVVRDAGAHEDASGI